MTNHHQDNAIYMVRVTQEHCDGLNLPEDVSAYSLYGDYTPARFSAVFPGVSMHDCLISKAGDYNGATIDIAVPDALQRTGNILQFLLRYHEPFPAADRRPRQAAEFDLPTLAALLDAQATFREQLKTPESLPPEIVQTILDYAAANGVDLDNLTIPA